MHDARQEPSLHLSFEFCRRERNLPYLSINMTRYDARRKDISTTPLTVRSKQTKKRKARNHMNQRVEENASTNRQHISPPHLDVLS